MGDTSDDDGTSDSGTGPPPAVVMLIRHGEKLGDPGDDGDGDINLSPRGAARAVALPTLFLPPDAATSCTLTAAGQDGFAGAYAPSPGSGGPPPFPIPETLFATATSKHSNRPQETIAPTAAALGRTVDANHKDDAKGCEKLAHHIRNHCGGQVVLVCWHHGTMQALAQDLGVTEPPEWPGKEVFDRVWKITYADDSAVLQDLPQALLFNDSAS